MLLFLDVPLRFPAPPVIGKIHFVIRKGSRLPVALANFWSGFFFNVQFYTQKCAVLSQFVQLEKKFCAVEKLQTLSMKT